MILIGHNITELRKLPEKSVHCVVTSPPYWSLRAYGTDPQTWGDGWVGELGSEPTPEMFVAHMVEVFAEVWRVLRDDGTCWVNLGDSYNNTDKWGGGGANTGKNTIADDGSVPSWEATRRKKPSIGGIKPKDLIGIPWRVAFALQAAGWYLRQDIIWHKPNPMPESVRDRCTKAHEYLFLLTKSERYFFDGDAISDRAVTAGKTNLGFSPDRALAMGRMASGNELTGGKDCIRGERKNRRSVWSISTHPYKGAHFATYPPRLVEPCILAGTSAKGCCPHCGKPWMRVIESKRVPTRSGANSKIHYVDPAGSPYADHKGKIVGNRDPLRHVSANITTGWQQACKCEAHEPVPCTVLDPFGGSGTTAIVAAHHGRKWIICELNPEYATLAEQRISEGWTPPKVKKPRRKRNAKQKALFNAEAC